MSWNWASQKQVVVQRARHFESKHAGLLRVFYGEETIHQFAVGKYRIGLYFPRYKLAIECDEFDHRDRDFGYEVERLKHIEKLFNCTFVRFNPDAKDFGILEVVNRIFVQIKSFFFLD